MSRNRSLKRLAIEKALESLDEPEIAKEIAKIASKHYHRDISPHEAGAMLSKISDIGMVKRIDRGSEKDTWMPRHLRRPQRGNIHV